ncbi:MAG TPA: hypothetical protein VGJ22_01110 [Anaerolineales bacterium]|jgi:hypothetical protein
MTEINTSAQQIFVELLDEGTIVYRPVSSAHVRDLVFKIEGKVPEGEAWAFMPGEIVECKSRQFSGGNIELIAIRALSSEEMDKL